MTLKDYMTEYNLSAQDVALLTGIDKRTITSYMQRKKEPRVANALKLIYFSDNEILIEDLAKTVVVIDEKTNSIKNPAKKILAFITSQRKQFEKSKKLKKEMGL